MRLMLRLQW